MNRVYYIRQQNNQSTEPEYLRTFLLYYKPTNGDNHWHSANIANGILGRLSTIWRLNEVPGTRLNTFSNFKLEFIYE